MKSLDSGNARISIRSLFMMITGVARRGGGAKWKIFVTLFWWSFSVT